jgi:putative addiction module component (TIGR02574 family)
MSPGTEQLLQTDLALPANEQVELIEALIAALDEADPQPLDDSWMAEIRRRSAEYDAGKATPIPWPVVRDRARGGDRSQG